LAVLALVLGLTGCGDTVNVDAADATAPTVSLDVAGIPLQAGASSQPNPETIDASCCDVTRTVAANTRLDFLAPVRDAESGVARAQIWQDLRITCVDPATDMATTTGPSSSQMASVGSAPTATPPATAPSQRIAQGSRTIGDLGACAPGEERHIELVVWAEGTNHAGLTARSKKITFKLEPGAG
jgi:hypothetical protein